MNLQSIFDIPELCYQYGVRQAIISPGSRNAALTVAFARHAGIRCLSVPDERSAAFVGLGMSLASKQPTVLICTSGSAGLNYAPAVAEAYFNQVPLLILTADRPPELIGKRDGQTIYQSALFGRHAKASFDYPSFDQNLQTQHACMIEALNSCIDGAPGPVHVNVPFAEPFYPESGKIYTASPDLIVKKPTNKSLPVKLPKALSTFRKILVVIGQQPKDDQLLQVLSLLSTDCHIPVIADVIGNCHGLKPLISHQDLILVNRDSNLAPDLLITCGLSVISKNLKLFLRDSPHSTHWHISTHDDAADTYDWSPLTIDSEPFDIFETMADQLTEESIPQKEYFTLWQSKEARAKMVLKEADRSTWTETSIYQEVLDQLPTAIDLHLANSMAVRYVNTLGISSTKDIQVYCNRGTSGIDGSNSTAVGACIASSRDTLLLTGDMAFLYDRNAFWHNHMPTNLKIIVFNNHGGGIFRMIEGPSAQPELKEFFETDQRSSARSTARDFGFAYFTARNMPELRETLASFMNFQDGRSILEIFTDAEENTTAYKQLFKKMKD
ncbi:2-succinyl-5-enolpyruvyl-6-hydroxy-3-cyclohexene-1-carboxylic-acid synthase [Reichenbachiella agarivorans]|uniref:2-succinyl-5-enolpyruvyl-6-hydroxy-3-cyclohexene-1-carboxylate synthase n=1 Tax=Reichenbachiella agarivorans TaxID=2979464 RepID=A0ABY6CM65_9BACT|nr:2-succinyl-5-enolpyruvyl-6-hydroxy-3-cyclohexene-1-carboxylic-acid synthase [Reichenbachiella agarivorans]UXP31610.1 2-succinyl-5-enolpyruvyl-6-hydroxy-3-cyclohexene-1-carboxylic-acid synthase [Reichenbachiella agarivorans]